MWIPAMIVALLLAFLAAVYRIGVRRLMAPRFARSDETPADHGLPYEDVQFTTADGLRLRDSLTATGLFHCHP